MDSAIVQSFFLIFAGASALATVALFTRQPLLVAYIAIGAALGPYGLGLVNDAHLISEIAEIGIIFLLFLLGLDMQPRSLLTLMRESMLVAIGSSAVFMAVGFLCAYLAGATYIEALLIGAACMFSSTIIGIKLLPTTVLHHRHVGELVVSLLLLQDLLAIALLLSIDALAGGPGASVAEASAWWSVAALPLLLTVTFTTVRFVLLPLIAQFDAFHEFIFLIAIGWCLAISVAARQLGLSYEMGAFVAGISLASSPIAQYIAESLRPLRDFFLVLFFFAVGAGFNLSLLAEVLLPALALAGVLLLVKPLVFRALLAWQGEPRDTTWEVGWRLGQLSEFSLLIAYLAAERTLLSVYASHLLQAAAIITFVLSSYLVVFRYPSPISPIARLRRD